MPCLGWYRDSQRGVLIMACAGEQSLSVWKKSYDIDCMEPKYRRAGQMMAMLHQATIYHADLKPNNFVAVNAHDTSDDVVLIDCDDVRFPRNLRMERRVKNLAQFFGGMGFAVTDVAHRRRLAEAAKEGYCRQAYMESFWTRSGIVRSMRLSGTSILIRMRPTVKWRTCSGVVEAILQIQCSKVAI